MGNFSPVSLDEWNSALVKTIFLDPSCAGLTLSRIDATGRIFDELRGSRSKDEAKRSFLNAFGKTPHLIRSRFKCSTKNAAFTQPDGIPPYFAALYLTLLSASADDETYEEGDFRVRFSILLGFSELQNFSFSDLPALWYQLADWSRRRRELNRDCAQLILPVPPASEKLIGHSKRLSFPCYKDEIRLRDLLENEKLDSHSPFQKINEAVYRNLSIFNEIFIYEVNAFNGFLLSASWQKAYNSPFWGAVRDITRYDENQQIAVNGRFCIQLDSADTWNPEIYLLMDQKGAEVLETHEIYTLPQQTDIIYTKYYYKSNANRTLIHLSSLLQKQKKGLSQSRVGMALKARCLPLFKDDSGYMSSDGHYFDGGPICLAIDCNYVKHINATCERINLKFRSLGINSELDEWQFLVFEAVSRQALTTLATALPKNAQRFLIQSWMPARPYLTGGARFGQAILLNPASTPFIRMEGANSGRYVISNSAGNELAVGELTFSDEGLYISPEKLIAISGQAFCRYLLTLDQQENPLVYDIPVLDHAPYAAYRRLKEPNSWLVDGTLGTLVSLEDIANNVSVPISVNKQKFTPLGGKWSLWQQNEYPLAECEHIDLHSIPVALDWLTEALALRFQKRSTLPFDELKKHVASVSIAVGIPEWRLRKMLFASGWLCMTESRYAPYPLITLTSRTISVSGDGNVTVARLSGMMTKSERNRLQCILAEGEQVKRLSVLGHDFAIGRIELNLLSIERVEWLAEQFGWRLITRADFPFSPLSGVILPIAEIENIPTLPVNINVSTWLEGKNKWSEESALIYPNSNALMRCQEKQRNRYFITTQNGVWQTDSFAWGLMVQTIFSKKILGTLSQRGDLCWSKNLVALPLPLTQWWLHFAGGCLSIGDDGHVSFVGGGSSIWGDIDRSDNTTQVFVDRATVRRSRALKLRRGR